MKLGKMTNFTMGPAVFWSSDVESCSVLSSCTRLTSESWISRERLISTADYPVSDPRVGRTLSSPRVNLWRTRRISWLPMESIAPRRSRSRPQVWRSYWTRRLLSQMSKSLVAGRQRTLLSTTTINRFRGEWRYLSCYKSHIIVYLQAEF